MTAATRLSPLRLATLAAMTAAVYAIELAVVHRMGARMPPARLATAATFDLALAVPLAWWLLGLRGTPGGGRRMLPVVLASLAGAALVVPGEGRALLAVLRLAVIPFELAALVVTVRTIAGVVKLPRSDADVAERLHEALAKALGDHGLSHLLAAEASALFFATVGTRAGTRRGAVARSGAVFTLEAARSPAFTWGLVLATVVESIAVHAIVGATHPLAAWLMTALGAYAVLWLLGMDRAIVARPVAVEADHLVLRAGLRLTARVAWSLVAGAEVVSWKAPPPRRSGYLDAARPVEANVVIVFREPVAVTGTFGVRRRVSRVGLCVDDPEGLRAAVEAAHRARSA